MSTTVPFSIRPFTVCDLLSLDPQDAQADELRMLLDFDLERCDLSHLRAFTARAGSCVLACSGIVRQWHGRWSAWAIYGNVAIANIRVMSLIARASKAFLDSQLSLNDVRRVECSVLSDFDRGHLFARRLGFTMDCVARRYDPLGRDHTLYSRV